MNRIAAERFVRRLEKLGAAGRAALKAEAGRPPRADVPAFDAFTAAFWSLRDTRLWRDACRLVAALYFWHPSARRPGRCRGGPRPGSRPRAGHGNRAAAGPAAGRPPFPAAWPTFRGGAAVVRRPRAGGLAATDSGPQPVGPAHHGTGTVGAGCVGEFLALLRE